MYTLQYTTIINLKQFSMCKIIKYIAINSLIYPTYACFSNTRDMVGGVTAVPSSV